MKRQYKAAILLFCSLILAGLCCPRAGAARLETHSTKGLRSKNAGTQNYSQWTRPIYSYLFQNKNGTFERVEYSYSDKCLYSETYDKNFKYKSGKKIKLELTYFGGLYATKDAYFVVEGNGNTQGAKNQVEFCIIKYDKNWKKLASQTLQNANTTVPFIYGSCRFAEQNGILYIRTCHIMYNGHQASVMLAVQMSDCKIITADTDVLNFDYGYVSHSFNQFLAVKNGTLYACDHGDGCPRGIGMARFDSLAPGYTYYNNKVTSVVPFSFAGEIGNNYTGACLGGFAVSGTHALAAGSSRVQSGDTDTAKNIFISTVPTGNFSQDAAKTTWLTSYAPKGKRTAGAPHLVPINANKYLVIWSEDAGPYGKFKYDRTCYTFIDGTGKNLGKTKTIYAQLSECPPIVCGNTVVWYTTERMLPQTSQRMTPSFYRLPLNGSPSTKLKKNTKFTKNNITYKVTKSTKSGGNVAITGCINRKSFQSLYLDGTAYYNVPAYQITATAPGVVYYNGGKYRITAIAPGAFKNCKNLSEVHIGKDITKIGSKAFYGCKRLNDVELCYKKYKKKNVGKNIFKKTSSLLSLTVPAKKVSAYRRLFKAETRKG